MVINIFLVFSIYILTVKCTISEEDDDERDRIISLFSGILYSNASKASGSCKNTTFFSRYDIESKTNSNIQVRNQRKVSTESYHNENM